ncbi:hypothetical protein DUI87_20946 [Hirundo rustica rustica]|uniref:Uncharacterized protein n=1 Tax=Hirundo rustica rustica TaxID=333673 RepID=A0A3M0JNE4_HIRRU|nr:hypothetical protein DUI87_20946 [Hirundo rustica rustica]
MSPEDFTTPLRNPAEEDLLKTIGNINVAPESPGEDPMNRAAAEEVSSDTESCRNSSPEPEEPGGVEISPCSGDIHQGHSSRLSQRDLPMVIVLGE